MGTLNCTNCGEKVLERRGETVYACPFCGSDALTQAKVDRRALREAAKRATAKPGEELALVSEASGVRVPAPRLRRVLGAVAIVLIMLGLGCLVAGVAAISSCEGSGEMADAATASGLFIGFGVAVLVAGGLLYGISRRRRCPVCEARVDLGSKACARCGAPLVFQRSPGMEWLSGLLETCLSNCVLVLAVPIGVVVALMLVFT